MAKKPQQSKKSNGSTEADAPDVQALAEDLQQKVGRDLSRSFSSLARGLMGAITETRESVDSLLDELREQSADTGEAIGKADDVSQSLKTIQAELNSRLSDEQLQARISELTRDAAEELEAEFAQTLETLEAQHGELKEEHSALEEGYSRVRMEQEFLEDLVDENIEIVTRYKPGQIEVLHQKVEALEAQRDELQERLTETNAKLDAAQRHNMRLLSEDDIADRQEIEAKIEKLAELREEQESTASLRAERDELRERLEELERLRERYEANQETVERNRELEAELREAKTKREKLEERYRHEKHERKKQTAKAQRLTSDVERLRQQSAAAETHAGELELELESFRESEEELKKKRQEYLDKLQELKEQGAALEQEHADRREQLEDQAEKSLDARRAELRAEVEKELERKYRDQLERLEDLEHVREKLNELRTEYRQATAGVVKWEAEASKRETQKAAEVEQIERLQDRVVELDEKRKALKTEVSELEQEIASRKVELAELEARVTALREQYADLDEELADEYEKRKERLEKQFEQRRGELDADRDNRIAPIHAGAFDLDELSSRSDVTEQEWLDGIVGKIEDADFHFPRRLVDAFHTSLKIAEWAPLTVLAGVSGTGKSELPRLYSMFGGLHYKMLSVQPNWDSPQDLFGFFNYMDNRYKATELLQALVQSQKDPDDGGFSDQLLVVLLDEMNLARVELYFSEFLSKLEARRGLEGDDTPYIGVDIGSGLDEEKVVLGDNVLFVGTMNEDETTNALSDKVLDRGNVITFPRPTSLRSRAITDPLKPTNQRLALTTWQSWTVEPEKDLSEDVREKIRDFMNGVNAGLSKVHRAVGHRVLQAIENYVANHPAVRASDIEATDEDWQRALGDQVVQKVMPKLRGVETDTERGRTCLDAMARLLREYTPELTDDFRGAREAGYGSFIWSSAEYLSS